MRTVYILLAMMLLVSARAWAGCDNLPPDVRDFLRSESGWSIVSLKDLYEVERSDWDKVHSGLCPGMAEGDFFGNGHQSYALALLSTVKGRTFERLVVLYRSGRVISSQELVRKTDMMYTNSPTIFVVWKTMPGVFFDLETGSHISISNESIVWEVIGSMSTMYYYTGRVFKSIIATE